MSTTLPELSVIAGEIVDSDAFEIGALHERSNSLLADAAFARLECGRRLAEKKAALPHGEWLPWLEVNAGTLGFSSKHTAARLMKAATKVASTLLLDDDEIIKLTREMWGNQDNHRAKGTGENEWYTPDEYLTAARDVLGGIDLDPASSDAAQEKVRAKSYFTKEDDGLSQEWAGRVWLNPPYSQPHIADFVAKLVKEYTAENTSAAILLTHNYTDTTWFHQAAGAANAICFTRGRIRFYDNNGDVAAPTQGQAFFYYGNDEDSFVARFSEIGFVVVRV